MYGKPYRGFESLSLRHAVWAAEKSCRHLLQHKRIINLTGQYVYELPLKIREHRSGYALNGRQISGTAFWHSGVPFSVLSTPYSANGQGIVQGSGPQFATLGIAILQQLWRRSECTIQTGLTFSVSQAKRGSSPSVVGSCATLMPRGGDRGFQRHA
jgi:hypothetical protein